MEGGIVTRYVALFGDPVAGNPTSRMQNAAFEAAGLDWRYLDIHVEAAALPAAVAAARVLGFDGLNLTIPHKVAVGSGQELLPTASSGRASSNPHPATSL
jgi:shikimate dehydrogenase